MLHHVAHHLHSAQEHWWGAKETWTLMASKTGRPVAYSPEEDAVLLNTVGEGAEYTNEVLVSLGYRPLSGTQMHGRRATISQGDRRPAVNDQARLVKLRELRARLLCQTEALEKEEALLRERLTQL